VNTRALVVDLLVVDTFAKCTLVEKLAKSWSLAPLNLAEPSVVDEEHAAITVVKLSSYCFFYS